MQIFRIHERMGAFEQNRAAYRKHFFLEEDVASQPRIVAVTVPDGEIHRLPGEIDDAGGRVQPDLDAGMTLPKAVEPAYQPLRAEAGLDADGQGPTHGAPVERLHGAPNLVESVAHTRQQRLAGRGELHGPVQAHEEDLAEVGLQRAHLLSDRRGGDVKLARRPAEALVPARGLEGPERIEGRKPPAHRINYFFIEKTAIVRCRSSIGYICFLHRRVVQATGREVLFRGNPS